MIQRLNAIEVKLKLELLVIIVGSSLQPGGYFLHTFSFKKVLTGLGLASC